MRALDVDETAAPPNLPTGTVTFLLTDVEGSTKLWEASRAAMASAIARHYQIIDECVRLNGGVRPLEQGEGDSTVSVFPVASNAVRAALAIQRALAEEPWPAGAEIKVRIGIHTGEAHLLEGGSYAGAAISRCARIRSLGHGGQILLSRTTADVVADYLAEDARLLDLGEHRLKDVSRPEQVFQLAHPSLRLEFPALASVVPTPTRLPTPLTSFIGRHAEIAELTSLIGKTRLLTLTGSGGSGKTRLALELVAWITERFPDGVWWVDLGPLAEASLVPSAIATVLGIREVPRGELAETIATQIENRHLLLVLDNCEHLASACASLVDLLLKRCDGLTMIVTSREPLGIQGETGWNVPSMGLPMEGESDSDVLTHAESVRLFVDRAISSRPRFRLTAGNAEAIGTICRRLDGMPLAIELAAARARTLTPQQILAGLSDRFALLTGGARTALARQRTLEASVEWSYNLLSEDEKVLFQRLSVFAGGFTLDAVEKVCAGDDLDEYTIFDLLSRLVERSLVNVDEEGADGRYRLLETIRDYARHRLTDSGEGPTVRTRHLDHFLDLVEQAEHELEKSGNVESADLLETEHDNIRAAMEWSVESAQADKALCLPGALPLFWWERNHLTEGRARLETALALDGGTSHSRAKALVAAAFTCLRMGDPAGSFPLAEQALTLGREVGDLRTIGRAALVGGWLATLSYPPVARPPVEEAIAAAETCGDTWGLSWASCALGTLDWLTGNREASRASFASALDIARSTANPMLVGQVLLYMALAESTVGGIAKGREAAREIIDIARHTRDLWSESIGHGILGICLLKGGDFSAARESIDAGLDLAHRFGIWVGIYALGYFTSLRLWAEGALDDARQQAEYALPLVPSPDCFNRGHALVIAARISEASGDVAAAHTLTEEALAHGRETQIPFHICGALQVLARLARRNDDADAEDLEHDALEKSVRAGLELNTIDSLEALAGMAAANDSFEEAARLFGSAQAARDAIGYAHFPVERKRYEADLTLVRDALGDAFEATWKQGAALTLEEAVAYATRARGQRRRPSHGWPSLTPTELQIVRLVREGLTNPQIAERLFIAKGTVRIHLSHVFPKLGVATRAELAAAAARRDL